jgi:hypothetical protein
MKDLDEGDTEEARRNRAIAGLKLAILMLPEAAESLSYFLPPPDLDAPCVFLDERHDVYPCVTHDAALHADFYDEAEFWGHKPICWRVAEHRSE